MIFRAIVITLLGSLLVIEVTGQVQARVAESHLAAHVASRSARAWCAATRPSNDNAAPLPRTAARGRVASSESPSATAERAARSLDRGETVLVDIRRAELDRLLGAPDVSTQARFVPTFRDDAPAGVKVYAIRPGGLFAALGLQAGDLVTTINDHPVSSSPPPDAFLTPRDRATFADITGRRDGHVLRIIVLVHP